MEDIREEIEEIKEEAPVYVPEDAIEEILKINIKREEEATQKAELENKEEEINEILKRKEELKEKIGILNNGLQIEEVRYYLTQLSEINTELNKANEEKDKMYGELGKKSTELKALSEGITEQVNEFTNTYNDKVIKYTKLVDDYLVTSNQATYNELMKIADDLSKFKRFDGGLEAILNSDKEEKKEEQKEEVKEEVKEEIKTEEPVKEVSETPVELNEVKVDEIEEKEEVNEVPTVETTVTPIVNEPTVEAPIAESIPSFDDITVVGEVPTEEAKVEIKPLLTSRLDKIADSNNKGVKSTINVFNSKKAELDDKKLTLAA